MISLNTESSSDLSPTYVASPEPKVGRSVMFPGFRNIGKKDVCTSIIIPGQGKIISEYEVSTASTFPDPISVRPPRLSKTKSLAFQSSTEDIEFSDEDAPAFVVEPQLKSFRIDTVGGPEKYLSMHRKLIFKSKKSRWPKCSKCSECCCLS